MSALTMEGSWKTLFGQVSAVGGCLDDRQELGEQLKRLDQAISDLVFYDDSLNVGEYLVHYTSWERAIAILSEPEPMLRSYNYERTNDPREGRLWRRAWDGLRSEAARFDKLLPSYEQTLLRSGRNTGSTFGCCFSAGGHGVEDNLTFWRLYGSDGKGCSFKVTSRLPKTYRVRYLDERLSNRSDDDGEVDRRVGDWLGDLLTRGNELVDQLLVDGRKDEASGVAGRICKVLGGYGHLAKSSDFEDENEWRTIDVTPRTNSVRYEVDEAGVVRRYVSGLSLEYGLTTGSSITVGPQVLNGGAARAYVEYLVEAYVERLAKAKELDVPAGTRDPAHATPAVNLSKQVYRSAL